MKGIGLTALTMIFLGMGLAATVSPVTSISLPSLNGPLQTTDIRFMQWSISPGGNSISPGQELDLFNRAIGEYIGYGTRERGINLLWHKEKPPSSKFTLTRASGSNEPIKYGEAVALRETHPRAGYIHYKKRDHGINLGWSATPLYEWEVKGGKNGNAVGDSTADITIVALYNTRIRKYIVYGKQSSGVNLVWK